MVYAFLGIIIVIVFISMKWDLIDPETHRSRPSSEENRVGYALLTFAMIAGIIILFMGMRSG